MLLLLKTEIGDKYLCCKDVDQTVSVGMCFIWPLGYLIAPRRSAGRHRVTLPQRGVIISRKSLKEAEIFETERRVFR
jgi:hypothetical protein